MNLSTQVIGCIGKCTSGLSLEELDHITDNIHNTLSHPRGVQIFKRYLEKRDFTDHIKCMELYEICCKFIVSGKSCSESPDVLIDYVTKVKERAEDLDGVPQIDMDLMRSYNAALRSKSKIDLLAVLEDTRDRCQDDLRTIHESFKKYASQPCPLAK